MANFGNALSGGVGGAYLGSTFGPWGTAAGGAIGGILGLFGKKKKKKPKGISTLDERQRQLYENQVQSLMGAGGQFSDLYEYNPDKANENFELNVSKPALRGFREDIIPQITGAFRGKNLQNSSYHGEALARAGRYVQENLNTQRSNMIYRGQEQAMQNKRNALDKVLGMQTQAYQRPEAPQSNLVDQILSSIGPAAGDWFADYIRSKRASKPA